MPLGYGENNPDFERNLAIVIGINDYRHNIPRLRTPGNDASRLADLLRETFGFEVEILVEGVTLQRLRRLLEQDLPACYLSDNDRLLIYFAGHGIALKSDEANDSPRGYLIPEDANPSDPTTFLPMTEFHEALSSLQCRHLLVILDCCFAGAIRWSTTRAIRYVPEEIFQERYRRYVENSAWQVLTSAAHDEEALDVIAGYVLGTRETAQNHSPFANLLFEALTGAGDIVPPARDGHPAGDGIITASELALYLNSSFYQSGHFQTPSLWPLRREDKGEFIFLLPGADPTNLRRAPELTFENNPYRGLKSFDPEHNEFFFGRQAALKELAEKVNEQPLTVVLGASGTGKSSLVKAGLIPILSSQAPFPSSSTDEMLPTTERPNWADPACWHVLPPLRPTEAPLKALNSLLDTHAPPSPPDMPNAPITNLTSKIENLLLAYPDQRLLLVIDQFEELVTLSKTDHTHHWFLNLLAELLQNHSERLRLVLTLRTDFEPHFTKSPLRPYWTEAARYVIQPMSRVELREAIEGPATKQVLYFEPPELVNELIDEVIQMPGGLPRLSFTLDVLYRCYLKQDRNDRALTGKDYEVIGGVTGSLTNQADTVYRELRDDAHRDTMRRLILRMISIEGNEIARRRVFEAELRYSDEAENQRVVTVLTALDKARLIVSDTDNEGRRYYEPAHDALVNGWDRVARWRLAEGDETIALQRRLTEAATEWKPTEQTDGQPDNLWHNNVRLPQVEEELEKGLYGERHALLRWLLQLRDYFLPRLLRPLKPYWLNALELNFIEQSLNRRRRNRRFVFYGIALFVAVILLGAGSANWFRIRAVEQQLEAERQAKISEARALTAQGELVYPENPLLGLRLALEAREILPEEDESHTASSIEGKIRDFIQNGRIATLATGDVKQLGILSDTGNFILLRTDGKLELRRTAEGSLVTQLSGSVDRIDFSSDQTGWFFVVYYRGGTPPELRRIADGSPIQLSGPVDRVDFSPDQPGPLFVVYYRGDTPSEVRRTADGSPVQLSDAITEAEFYGNNKLGTYLKVRYKNGLYALWGLQDEPYLLTWFDSGLQSTYFDLEWKRLITEYQGGRARLLDLAWLEAIGGKAERLPEEQLIEVACMPFKTELFDENLLTDEDYLGDRPPQACQRN